jgi:hypothetical protein
MKINRTTLVLLVIALAVIFGLDAFGEALGMAPHALDRVQEAAAGLTALGLALAGKLLTKDEDGDGVPDWLQRLLGLVLAGGIVLGSAYGCNGPQHVISTQAEILVATQPARFDAYRALHDVCVVQSETIEVYDACMEPAVAVARAADAYREALYAAQAAVHLGEGGPAIGCAIEAARRLLAALQAAGMPIPGEVLTIAAMIPEVSCAAQ